MHNPSMLFPRLALSVALGTLLIAGCGGADDRPPTWSFISATITEPSCATVNCHSQVTQKGGLDLNDRETGYYNLVNGFYVIPGQPAQSSLIDWLNGKAPLRMPPDNPLPASDVELIETWITDGAANN